MSPSKVHFVITIAWVNSHDFAGFFRDGLGCDNAPFLDGGIACGLYDRNWGVFHSTDKRHFTKHDPAIVAARAKWRPLGDLSQAMAD